MAILHRCPDCSGETLQQRTTVYEDGGEESYFECINQRCGLRVRIEDLADLEEVERRVNFDGPCPFLMCLENDRHSHGVCPKCGAVYSTKEAEEGGHDAFYHQERER